MPSIHETSSPTLRIRKELHVSKSGKDTNSGTPASPLKTIAAASMLAMPGDTILVHAGIYRERIDPPRGGESETQRITYQAAKGERVELLGSEQITNWQRLDGSIWQATVPNEQFRDYNPYDDLIRGDWFNDKGRTHHTGCLYLDGEWLTESESRHALAAMHWFAQVGADVTTFWANFGEQNPNAAKTEINARSTVFYPSQAGINYITVNGFIMRHAATNWAPPTAEQIGLIGTNWSQGWVIEHNVISHSRCVGVTLGKHGDAYDNTSEGSATGFLETIERARASAWQRGSVGNHIVRHNQISHCEQAGIAGSLGAIFSQITDNTIHNIYQLRAFAGEELAAIKIHGAIDTLIARNHIYHAYRAIWLDWMAQGARVTQNLCYENDLEDLFLEVNHGPNIIDSNCFLSAVSLNNMSQGSAFVQNIFAGKLQVVAEPHRETPSLKAHSTEFHKSQAIAGGDDHYLYNFVFDPAGLELACASRRDALTGDWSLDPDTGLPWVNALASQTWPSKQQGNLRLVAAATLSIVGESYLLNLELEPDTALPNESVNTESFGKNLMTGLPYLNYDGSPLEWSIRSGVLLGLKASNQMLRIEVSM